MSRTPENDEVQGEVMEGPAVVDIDELRRKHAWEAQNNTVVSMEDFREIEYMDAHLPATRASETPTSHEPPAAILAVAEDLPPAVVHESALGSAIEDVRRSFGVIVDMVERRKRAEYDLRGDGEWNGLVKGLKNIRARKKDIDAVDEETLPPETLAKHQRLKLKLEQDSTSMSAREFDAQNFVAHADHDIASRIAQTLARFSALPKDLQGAIMQMDKSYEEEVFKKYDLSPDAASLVNIEMARRKREKLARLASVAGTPALADYSREEIETALTERGIPTENIGDGIIELVRVHKAEEAARVAEGVAAYNARMHASTSSIERARAARSAEGNTATDAEVAEEVSALHATLPTPVPEAEELPPPSTLHAVVVGGASVQPLSGVYYQAVGDEAIYDKKTGLRVDNPDTAGGVAPTKDPIDYRGTPALLRAEGGLITRGSTTDPESMLEHAALEKILRAKREKKVYPKVDTTPDPSLKSFYTLNEDGTIKNDDAQVEAGEVVAAMPFPDAPVDEAVSQEMIDGWSEQGIVIPKGATAAEANKIIRDVDEARAMESIRADDARIAKEVGAVHTTPPTPVPEAEELPPLLSEEVPTITTTENGTTYNSALDTQWANRAVGIEAPAWSLVGDEKESPTEAPTTSPKERMELDEVGEQWASFITREYGLDVDDNNAAPLPLLAEVVAKVEELESLAMHNLEIDLSMGGDEVVEAESHIADALALRVRQGVSSLDAITGLISGTEGQIKFAKESGDVDGANYWELVYLPILLKKLNSQSTDTASPDLPLASDDPRWVMDVNTPFPPYPPENFEETRMPISPRVIRRFEGKFGIDEGALEKIEEFHALSTGQQMLVLRNLEQLTLSDITKEAKEKQRAEWGNTKWWKRGVQMAASFGMKPEVRIAEIEKELLASSRSQIKHSRNPEDVRRRAMTLGYIESLSEVAASSPEVVMEKGEMRINYVSIKEQYALAEHDGFTHENIAAIEAFNKTATDFAKIPHEWGYDDESVGPIMGSLTRALDDSLSVFRRKRPDEMKTNRELYEQSKHAYDRARAGLLELSVQKFEARGESKPEERAMLEMNILDERVTLNQLFNTHPDAETALQSIEDHSVWRRGMKEFWKARGNFIAYGALGRAATVTAASALAVPTMGASLLALGAVGGAGLMVGNKIGETEGKRLMKGRRLSGRMSEEDEREEVVYMNESKGIAEKRKIKEFTDAAFFVDRIERLVAKSNTEKDPTAFALVEKKIAQTTALMAAKLEAGMINFGGSSLGDTDLRRGDTIANRLSFMQAMARGTIETTVDRDVFDAHAERLIGVREARIEDVRKAEVKQIARTAAFWRAGFGLVGAGILQQIAAEAPMRSTLSRLLSKLPAATSADDVPEEIVESVKKAPPATPPAKPTPSPTAIHTDDSPDDDEEVVATPPPRPTTGTPSGAQGWTLPNPARAPETPSAPVEAPKAFGQPRSFLKYPHQPAQSYGETAGVGGSTAGMEASRNATLEATAVSTTMNTVKTLEAQMSRMLSGGELVAIKKITILELNTTNPAKLKSVGEIKTTLLDAMKSSAKELSPEEIGAIVKKVP